MSYIVHNHDCVSFVSPPFYNGISGHYRSYRLRDTESYEKKVLEDRFKQACELFAEKIYEFQKLNRALTYIEKNKLVSSFEVLLELQILLKKTNKESRD